MFIEREVPVPTLLAIPSDTVVLDDSTKIEDTAESATVLPLDPFHLRDAIQSEKQLQGLRMRRNGKKLQKYHSRQNDLIISLLKPMEEHSSEAKDEEDAVRLPVKIAVWASLIANLSLCVLQMYAAISSLSLSLFATGVDSAESMDTDKWPVGGARLGTIGNIVYGFLMSSVNLVIIVESIRDLITHSGGIMKSFHLPSIIAVASALFVKILLFFYCLSLRKNSSQVRVLWEDHRNDLFINAFGILMSTGGSKLRWFLDPMGGFIIASGVTLAWGKTMYDEFGLLAGKSAPDSLLQLLTYKTLTFHEDIEAVDTVRAYHSGPEYFVEVDIVMDRETPLWQAHDISERLQEKIEGLRDVERAFVHVDYESTHYPEHRKS
ncbi:hypothetical protein BDP27DRAFT_1391263 [Rhodocollybia butyracea]|uniref:Cation efflux protein cytoplasmic domain-containing protein n=1 Tax=Rhodocollybia butyracea TaxID=206335 RepID=A0A9P5Q355_9AGAR|nr:hypothetical protein BDP27DRAFT_1391263 [Rhodocollybia butyracea]